ncbi:cytochrome P450 [Pendulispora brunnea]|uniref:Cytochrome P450 n=1 Tax=Pendulispora brunnea TaxID=2905690 RepID=A0ABZ2JXF0_9BACT
MLFNLDMPNHSRVRRVVNGPYGSGGVRSLERVLDEVLDERCAALRAQSSPDLYETVLDEVTIRVNSTFLGLRLSDREHYRRLGQTLLRMPADDIHGLRGAIGALYDYVLWLIHHERELAPDGFVHRLVAGRHDSDPPLTDDELVAILLLSVVGGDQNVLSVLTKSVYTLLVARPLWERLVANPEIAPDLVEELIRLIPVGRISTFPRVSTRPIVTSHGELPAGTAVYADAFAANRDPLAFPAPRTIDPTRRGARHVQFGYGMHHCMASALARLEITAVIGRLAREFPRLELTVPPESLPWDTGTLLRRPTTLPVRW